jgi:hypothetical protein
MYYWDKAVPILWVNWEFIQHNAQFFVAAIAAVALIVGVHVWNQYDAREEHAQREKRLSIRSERERWMTRPERENVLNVLLSDAICDGVEDLIFQGKMTREEGVTYYRRLANILNLPHLLQKHEQVLKARLQKRQRNTKVIPFPDVKKSTANGSGRAARLRKQA